MRYVCHCVSVFLCARNYSKDLIFGEFSSSADVLFTGIHDLQRHFCLSDALTQVDKQINLGM